MDFQNPPVEIYEHIQSEESYPKSKIQKQASFFMLEKAADADLAESLQSGWASQWNLYQKELYFRDIADRYEKAGLMAIQLSMDSDAARIIEKQAMIFAEKLDNVPAAIYKLLDAWKLSSRTGDSAKTDSIRNKLYAFADQEIALHFSQRERPEFAPFHWYCNFCIARALLTKAEVAEVTDPLLAEDLHRQVERFCSENDVSYSYVKETQHGSSEEMVEMLDDHCTEIIDAADRLEKANLKESAALVYEEAAKVCMARFEEGVAIDHLHSALVAGLCFEKTRLQEQAKQAYEKVLEDLDQIDSVCSKDMIDECFRFIFAAPCYLEASLASLRCGKEDVFGQIMRRQIQDLASIFQKCANVSEIDDQLMGFVDYATALISVTEILLGSDSSSAIEMKEEFKKSLPIRFDASGKGSLQKTEFEAALLAVYAAPPDTTVKEMIRRLEDNRLIRP